MFTSHYPNFSIKDHTDFFNTDFQKSTYFLVNVFQVQKIVIPLWKFQKGTHFRSNDGIKQNKRINSTTLTHTHTHKYKKNPTPVPNKKTRWRNDQKYFFAIILDSLFFPFILKT